MRSRIVSIFSLILLTCTAALSADYVALKLTVNAIHDKGQEIQLLKNRAKEFDAQLTNKIERTSSDPDQLDISEINDMISLRAKLQTGQTATSQDAQITAAAKSIKSSPLYHDSGVQGDSNWMAKAFARLANLFHPNVDSVPTATSMPSVSGGQTLIYIVSACIFAAIAVFLYFIVRHFSWQKRLKRKSSALLEDDEPERTLDEWLDLSNSLVLEGRYREAVRCLYLACLLKFDEADLARFKRNETNWEHLSRIQASPKRPPDFDFLPPTKAFDQIWYGHHVRGIEDVEQFRIWYSHASQLVTGGKAA